MTSSDVDARVHHIVVRIDHNWRMGVVFATPSGAKNGRVAH